MTYKVVMRNDNGVKGLQDFCQEIKSRLGDNLTIVEVGSFMGESSLILAENFPNSKIYCIDPWVNGYDHNDTTSSYNLIDAENQFDLRTKDKNNIFKIKDFSTNQEIDCDLVYIDGCHKYECVVEDINHWKKFTTKVISGHDFYNDEIDRIQPHTAGVRKAVLELIGEPDSVFVDGSWVKFI